MRRVDHLLEEIEPALAAIVTALRTMSSGRISAPLTGPIKTRADAGRMLARALVVAAQGIEEAGSQTMPAWRRLPDVPDLVVGDQVNVVARDLRLAADGFRGLEVWTPDGRAQLVDVLTDVLATAREVRRLP